MVKVQNTLYETMPASADEGGPDRDRNVAGIVDMSADTQHIGREDRSLGLLSRSAPLAQRRSLFRR